MRTYQYKREASSPSRMVPAATVNPSGETSQDSKGRLLPDESACTVQTARLEFSRVIHYQKDEKRKLTLHGSAACPLVPDLDERIFP